MITIITGAPGAGKSSYLVAELQRFRAEHPERPVFVGGVPGLQLEHEVLPDPAQWVEAREGANGWRWRFPDGALIVLDEAQSVFRPRSTGSAVPPIVAALEVHRHQGLDVWLVTQAPSLIDANVRRLCGRHVHLRVTWSGRQLCEWPECVDPSGRAQRATAVTRPFRLPKGVFGLYQSASLHTRTRVRRPWQLYLVGVILVGVALGAWRIYGRWYGDTYVLNKAPVADLPAGDGDALRLTQSAGVLGVPLTPAAFVPRLRDRPESAPLYDQVREVQQVPIVQGCVASATRCKCYTQQATDAYLSEDVCRAWIASPPFQPFREPRVERREPPPVRQAERSEDADGGGPRVVLIEEGDRLGEAVAAQPSSEAQPRPRNLGPHRSVQLPRL